MSDNKEGFSWRKGYCNGDHAGGQHTLPASVHLDAGHLL